VQSVGKHAQAPISSSPAISGLAPDHLPGFELGPSPPGVRSHWRFRLTSSNSTRAWSDAKTRLGDQKALSASIKIPSKAHWNRFLGNHSTYLESCLRLALFWLLDVSSTFPRAALATKVSGGLSTLETYVFSCYFSDTRRAANAGSILTYTASSYPVDST
jgi:hypothetical protein